MTTLRTVTWVLLTLLALPDSAHAQDRRKRGKARPPPGGSSAPMERAPAKPSPAKQAEGAAAERPEVQVESTGRKKVYRIKTEFVIEGRIQKPNAFYVLQRSNINYEWVDLKQDFAPRILQTVREHPF